MLVVGAVGLKAQDCYSIVLPYYNGDSAYLDSYPVEKLEWRCQYARNAFYWSDIVPTGAVEKSLAQVRNRQTGEYMTDGSEIDLNTISYYAYTFVDLQYEYRETTVTIYFATPGAAHPYLVLRSIDEMYRRTEYPELYENK